MPRRKTPWELICSLFTLIIAIALVCAMYIMIRQCEQMYSNATAALNAAATEAANEAAKAVEEAAAEAANEAVKAVNEAAAKAADEAAAKAADEAAAKAADEAAAKVANEAVNAVDEATIKAITEAATKAADEAAAKAVAEAIAAENGKNGIYAGDSNATVTFYGNPGAVVNTNTHTHTMSVADASYTLSSSVEIFEFYNELEGFSKDFLDHTFGYNAAGHDEWTISLSGNVKISAVEFFTNTPNTDGLQAYWGDNATKTARIDFTDPVNSVIISNIVNDLYTHRVTIYLTDGTAINGCYSDMGR